jgi:hypothetical protein
MKKKNLKSKIAYTPFKQEAIRFFKKFHTITVDYFLVLFADNRGRANFPSENGGKNRHERCEVLESNQISPLTLDLSKAQKNRLWAGHCIERWPVFL